MDVEQLYQIVVQLKRDMEKVDAHHGKTIAALETRIIDRLNSVEVRLADLERRLRDKR